MVQDKTEKMNDILDNALVAYNNKVVSINTNNGILNENFLERQKNIFLKDTLSYHRDTLIKSKQEYPIDDISDVQLTTEFFILKRKDYLELKQLLNE